MSHPHGCSHDDSGNSQNSQSKTKSKYKFLRHIGSGSFGEIYAGVNTATEEPVAIKVESNTIKNPQLYLEFSLYSKSLNGRHGFPAVYEYSRTKRYSYFVMTLLGENLEKLFDLCGRKFSDKTVLLIAEQLITRLEMLHRQSKHLHRDIKPENLLMGLGKNVSTLYLVDLGLAKPYVDRTTGLHIIPRKIRRTLTGTARYASVNAHQGRDQSRRDDMESAAYVLLYFAKGRLPWQGVTGVTKKERYDKISEKKMATSTDELCSGVMPTLKHYLEYVKNLGFDEKPDYRRLQSMFRDALILRGWKSDGKFDWMIEPKEE